MTKHDPGPYFVRIYSHSASGPHVNQISINTYNDGSGEVTCWDTTTIQLDDMVNDLVAVLVPFFNSTYHYDSFTAFNVPSPGDDPIVLSSHALGGTAGTDTSATWATATERITTWRTVGNAIARLTLLDCVTNDNFNPVFSLSPGALEDLSNEFTETNRGWAGRDNTRPATFLSSTIDLNDKLRKAYRLT